MVLYLLHTVSCKQFQEDLEQHNVKIVEAFIYYLLSIMLTTYAYGGKIYIPVMLRLFESHL